MMRTLFLSCIWKPSGGSSSADKEILTGSEGRVKFINWLSIPSSVIYQVQSFYKKANLYEMLSTVNKQENFQWEASPQRLLQLKSVENNLKIKLDMISENIDGSKKWIQISGLQDKWPIWIMGQEKRPFLTFKTFNLHRNSCKTLQERKKMA